VDIHLGTGGNDPGYEPINVKPLGCKAEHRRGIWHYKTARGRDLTLKGALDDIILAASCSVSVCTRVLCFHILPCKAISRK